MSSKIDVQENAQAVEQHDSSEIHVVQSATADNTATSAKRGSGLKLKLRTKVPATEAQTKTSTTPTEATNNVNSTVNSTTTNDAPAIDIELFTKDMMAAGPSIFAVPPIAITTTGSGAVAGLRTVDSGTAAVAGNEPPAVTPQLIANLQGPAVPASPQMTFAPTNVHEAELAAPDTTARRTHREQHSRRGKSGFASCIDRVFDDYLKGIGITRWGCACASLLIALVLLCVVITLLFSRSKTADAAK